jgi:hypothetical protein
VDPVGNGFSISNLSTYGVNNFWNTETSLQSTSGTGAIGKTIAQMKTQSTFTDWDFTDVWAIDSGSSYPYLQENEQISHPVPEISVISNPIPSTYKILSLDISIDSRFEFCLHIS